MCGEMFLADIQIRDIFKDPRGLGVKGSSKKIDKSRTLEPSNPCLPAGRLESLTEGEKP
jgi:hypothetical protein